MDRDVKNMLHRLHEAVKTPDDEVMVLPFGNSSPEEVISWIDSLDDYEFSLLMKTPIIIQAKHFYTELRKRLRGE